MSISRGATVAAAAVLTVAFAGAAFAGFGESIPTTLKMRNSAPAFHGKVRSAAPECEADRRVKLFKERRSGARTVLGRTESDPDGGWLIPVDPLRSGAYIAKVKQHLVEIDGLAVRCEPDFGRAIVVD
jgi:hypothetical protein